MLNALCIFWVVSLKRLSEISLSWDFNQSLAASCILHYAFCIYSDLVESTGIEPVTSCLQGRRSPSWANPPYRVNAECIMHNAELLAFILHSSFWILHLIKLKWWAKMDSNHRPHDYQSCALASWAIGPFRSLRSNAECIMHNSELFHSALCILHSAFSAGCAL